VVFCIPDTLTRQRFRPQFSVAVEPPHWGQRRDLFGCDPG